MYRLTITYAGSETDVMYYDTLEDAEKAKSDIVTPFSNCSGTIEKVSRINPHMLSLEV